MQLFKWKNGDTTKFDKGGQLLKVEQLIGNFCRISATVRVKTQRFVVCFRYGIRISRKTNQRVIGVKSIVNEAGWK